MEYGICLLGSIPCRKEASDASEMISQLLFGETYTVLEEQEKWVKIESTHDNYVSWICIKQHQKITESSYQEISSTLSSVVVSRGAYLIEKDNGRIYLPIGAKLPNLDGKTISIENFEYSFFGEASNTELDNLDNFEETVLSFLNTPYLWGGRTESGIDCSGFVQNAFRIHNITLPRDAYQQAEIGTTVTVDKLQLGDLVYFKNDKGRITHVGTMLDDKNIIHASGKVRIDSVDEKGIWNNTLEKYSHSFAFCKRVEH